jgi:transcription initiation factor TFIIIB Brf1 subunit/transcription initiation factor TFIIB
MVFLGRKRMQHLAAQLRIPTPRVDAALNFFKLALDRNMTKGRTAMQVTAACLYIACRADLSGCERIFLKLLANYKRQSFIARYL